MYQAYHFSRYLEDQTVNIAGGGDQDITNGWYTIMDLIFFIGDSLGDTGLYYDGDTNRVKSSTVGATYDFSSAAADLMGYTAASASKDGTRPPVSTWAPKEIGFKYSWDPLDDEGAEPVYDCTTSVAIDGTIWAMGSEAIEEERFRLSLIEDTKVIGTAASGDFSATWRDVWRPDLGIHFIWAKADTLAGLGLTYAQIFSAWTYKEYAIRDCMAVQQSRRIQYDDNSKYHTLELPLIYKGLGQPS